MEKNKGVTLIALIITIIILLILAGITINMVLGNNGIIAKAQIAKEQTQEKQKDEEEELAKLENNVDKYITNRVGTAQKTEMKSDGTEFITNETLDGKTVYGRYFETPLGSYGATDVNHNIENIETIWIDSGNSYMEDEVNYVLPVSSGANYMVDKTMIRTYPISSNFNGKKLKLLLKYTKTKD